MDARHCTTLGGLLVLALQPSLPALADADEAPRPRFALVADHSDDPVLGIVGTGTVQFETPAPPVPRECKPRYMAGPAVGVVVGPGAIVGGLFLATSGSGSGLTLLGFEHERTSGDKWRIAGGTLVAAAGLGAFLYSIGKLTVNRRERRRVCESDTPQSK